MLDFWIMAGKWQSLLVAGFPWVHMTAGYGPCRVWDPQHEKHSNCTSRKLCMTHDSMMMKTATFVVGVKVFVPLCWLGSQWVACNGCTQPHPAELVCLRPKTFWRSIYVDLSSFESLGWNINICSGWSFLTRARFDNGIPQQFVTTSI